MSNSISTVDVPAEDALRLDDAAAMLRLGEATGRVLAGDHRAAKPAEHVRAVLLHGPLGAGKTTFVRGFVEALPGSEAAEVSSPSFTLCNSYPTRPAVLHCDLYRSEDLTPDGTLANLPEEVDEALEADRIIVMDGGKIAIDGAPREVFRESSKLKEMGLGVPIAKDVAERMLENGLPIDTDILNEEELIDRLCQLL